jgi:hypothetical protein
VSLSFSRSEWKRKGIFKPGQGDARVVVNAAEAEFQRRANEFGLVLVRLCPTMRVWVQHFSFFFFFEFELLSRANVY